MTVIFPNTVLYPKHLHPIYVLAAEDYAIFLHCCQDGCLIYFAKFWEAYQQMFTQPLGCHLNYLSCLACLSLEQWLLRVLQHAFMEMTPPNLLIRKAIIWISNCCSSPHCSSTSWKAICLCGLQFWMPSNKKNNTQLSIFFRRLSSKTNIWIPHTCWTAWGKSVHTSFSALHKMAIMIIDNNYRLSFSFS